MRSFEVELFEYITTIVPSFRVCDEAWPIGSDHLTGIGVLRNYGGQVMVMPWNQNTRLQLSRFRELLDRFLTRIVVVIDDREREGTETRTAELTPIAVLPWSRRSELAAFVIKDAPD